MQKEYLLEAVSFFEVGANFASRPGLGEFQIRNSPHLANQKQKKEPESTNSHLFYIADMNEALFEEKIE